MLLFFFLLIFQNIFLNYKPDPIQCQGNEIFKLYLFANLGMLFSQECVCAMILRRKRGMKDYT